MLLELEDELDFVFLLWALHKNLYGDYFNYVTGSDDQVYFGKLRTDHPQYNVQRQERIRPIGEAWF